MREILFRAKAINRNKGYHNNKSTNKTEKGRSRVMARYIDAEELKQERDMAIKAYENANIFTAKAIREHIKPLLDKIVDIPTADVAEVKHGRWKGAGMGDYYCSLCCETYSGGDGFAYCPNCGAKMDGR